MKIKLAIACIMAGGLLAPMISSAEDADADRAHPEAFVKDSVITTKVKSKLAAEHLNSLGNIKVDTDANGVVYLSGSAHSQADVDQAISIARGTEGVKSVKSDLTVKKDD